MKKRILILTMLTLVVSYTSAITSSGDKLQKDFKNLPGNQRVAVYWYLISDKIPVEGVEHDLEAMKKAGIKPAATMKVSAVVSISLMGALLTKPLPMHSTCHTAQLSYKAAKSYHPMDTFNEVIFADSCV